MPSTKQVHISQKTVSIKSAAACRDDHKLSTTWDNTPSGLSNQGVLKYDLSLKIEFELENDLHNRIFL